MNEQTRELAQLMSAMMVMSMSAGMMKPVMLQTARKDIRLEPDHVKTQYYERIHERYRLGHRVSVKEHYSGFPAVTVDCDDIRIVTDIMSLERWYDRNAGMVKPIMLQGHGDKEYLLRLLQESYFEELEDSRKYERLSMLAYKLGFHGVGRKLIEIGKDELRHAKMIQDMAGAVKEN